MYQERECDYRTPFQRDRDRIIHCKAFRRLMHKTQVFIAPEGDHYRTRLTHTLEVSQIARTAARALGLNEDLTEAIALGHDLGHTPFGHAGEATLNDLVPGGFSHNQQSLRVVDVLEEKDPAYRGLNLTWEVRDGILNHTGPQMPATLEGQIVKLSDRIAYINHDIDDALRAGLITLEQLPSPALEVLGRDHSQRIDRMIRDLVEYSQDRGYIAMSPPIWEATNLLRDFLFAHVYVGSAAKQEESKVRDTLSRLYVFYVENPQELPEYIQAVPVEPGRDRAVDYIAGMTDRFAMADYVEKFLPQGWRR
jgi:dGTPase